MTHLSAAALLIVQLAVVAALSSHQPPHDTFEGLAATTRDMHFDSPDHNPIDSEHDDSNSNNATRILRRGKRYLQFSKGSRMSVRKLYPVLIGGQSQGYLIRFPFPSPGSSVAYQRQEQSVEDKHAVGLRLWVPNELSLSLHRGAEKGQRRVLSPL